MPGDVEGGGIESPIGNTFNDPNDSFEKGDVDAPEDELQIIEKDEERIIADAEALDLTQGVENIYDIKRVENRVGTLEEGLGDIQEIKGLIITGAYA
jgi:hypothetical protein